MSEILPQHAPRSRDAESEDGIVVIDRVGRITAGDEIAAVRLGFDADTLVGRELTDLLDLDDRQWLEEVLHHDGLGSDEHTVHTRSGQAVRLLCKGPGRFLVTDDSAHAAVQAEAESSSSDAARGELAAAVARELNDPMAIVQGRIELLLELGGATSELDPDMVRKHLGIALDHARRVSSTLHLLRLVGGPLDGALQATAARRIVERAAGQVGDLDALEIAIHPDTLRLLGPADLLQQVLVGLLRRVRDACRGGNQARVVGLESRGHAILEVMAEPPSSGRFTPVPASGDPRLDVGVSELVLSRIGGRLESYRLGRGVLFRVTLPQAPPLSRRRSRVDGSVLVVGAPSPTDLCALLYEEGVDTTCVPDVKSALGAIDELTPVGVVSNLVLPGVGGLSLLREVLDRYPALSGRLVLVGRRHPPGVPDGVHVIRPPIDRATLLSGLGLPP